MRLRESAFGVAVGVVLLVLATAGAAAGDVVDYSYNPYAKAGEEASRSANHASASADAALRASRDAKRAAEAAKQAADVAAQQNTAIIAGLAVVISVLVPVALVLLYRLRKTQAQVAAAESDD
jgi:pyruvate/2-oxoglutarate dehydrogenase complex dihydrolipoamide acyltransferase (E2) component